ncbi:uncharacterized protein LOC135226175 [Macrobrachium nipponense]|uniref:uncharacterized protein LOC135226175 n=1 Tax=Macrobrachium nipponense TaxID=159736 RepID=UPI0030C7E8BC
MEFEKIVNKQVVAELSTKGVTWIFNPPYASHFGGIWERQIRSVRSILGALLQHQVLNEDNLRTLLCEVEAILNSRPLTRSSEDPHDLEPITPAHILTLKGSVTSPGVFQWQDLYVKQKWRQVQYLADQFWIRWRREYLPLLQERQRWNSKRHNLAINDVVLVLDKDTPRGSWSLGKVLEVVKFQSWLVRKARIKTKSGEYLRPISK